MTPVYHHAVLIAFVGGGCDGEYLHRNGQRVTRDKAEAREFFTAPEALDFIKPRLTGLNRPLRSVKIVPAPSSMPPAEHVAALQAFADAHGRGWKDELSQVYWYNARIWCGPEPGMGTRLHEVRNGFGPTWLYDVCAITPTPKAKKA